MKFNKLGKWRYIFIYSIIDRQTSTHMIWGCKFFYHWKMEMGIISEFENRGQLNKFSCCNNIWIASKLNVPSFNTRYRVYLSVFWIEWQQNFNNLILKFDSNPCRTVRRGGDRLLWILDCDNDPSAIDLFLKNWKNCIHNHNLFNSITIFLIFDFFLLFYKRDKNQIVWRFKIIFVDAIFSKNLKKKIYFETNC